MFETPVVLPAGAVPPCVKLNVIGPARKYGAYGYSPAAVTVTELDADFVESA